MTAHLAVIGSMRVDLVLRLARSPGLGETVPASAFERHSGGRGLSQAAAAAALGAQVSLISCLGDDEYGPWLRQVAEDTGIDGSFIDTAPGPSGIAVVEVVSEQGQRTAQLPGAIDALTPDRASGAVTGLAKLDMVLGQAELPLEVTAAAFTAARARGARTLLNAAPCSPELIAGMPDLYPLVDIIVMDNRVAAELTGLATEVAVDTDEAAQAIVDRGVLRVVITRGHRGSIWRAPGASGSIPVMPARMVDSTGAGSAFCAGLAVGLAEGMPFHEALRLASAASALSTTVTGSVRNMPTREAVEELLELRG